MEKNLGKAENSFNMETKFLKAGEESLEMASNLIKNGEIVAIPTETVYGIAGNAYMDSAIEKIFIAKGRPQDNPLIVHISDMDMLYDVVRFVPDDAIKLAKAFWPGALTMVLPKGDKVAPSTCAGLDSVGVRMPSDKFAHDLIVKSKVPFAAPSANISGKPSPTNAEDVYADMKGRLPLVVDGGESIRGVESTVLSLLDEPILLRPGIVTKEQIEEVLGKSVLVSKSITKSVEEGEKVLSPGMKYKHYSPNAEVIIVDAPFEKFLEYVEKNKGEKTFALVFKGEEEKLDIPCLVLGGIDNEEEQAHNLFKLLRQVDKLGAKTVFARCPKKDGVALAVYNRLVRAAGFRVVTVS